MAGKGVRVLVTPTSDLGKILALHVWFGNWCSPVGYDRKTLESIGRKLKKHNVSVDVVDFGETEDGKSEKLEALVAAVNANGSGHIIHVPPGPDALPDVLTSTPIFTGDGGGGSGFAAAAGGMPGYDFGVDPNLDPELALALRVSMEEERARLEAAAQKAAEEDAKQENRREASFKFSGCNYG